MKGPETAEKRPHEMPSSLLDWRFLLAKPSFGRTLVLGKAPNDRGPMLAALHEVSHVHPADGRAGSVDGAVVFGTDVADLATASRAVREGGWIYVEVRRHGRPLRLATLTVPIRRAGFTRLRTYWHWPSFATSRELVPLDDRAALRASLARRSRSGLQSVLYRSAAALERIGLFEAIAPHVSVVGIRGKGR